jgi:hypothetical protein
MGSGTGIAISLLLGVAVAVGCSPAEDDSDSGGSDITAAASDKFGPTLFRDDFFTHLKKAKKPDGTPYSDDDVRKLVYLPTDAVMKPGVPDSAKGADRLAALDKAFTSILPSQLFKAGAAPFTQQDDLDSVLLDNPVHIIVVPGIFGEFIPRTPFEEIFSAHTVASAEWATKGAAVTDLRFNVKTLQSDTRALSEIIRVGSIDGVDASGAVKPLVTVAYLAAGLGSMEDFGTLAENNEVYLRRLDAYFQAIGGVPNNLYLMGYSRGTATALDLLVRARRAQKPWAQHLKGFLAHAGVIYGSQLADASFSSGPGTDSINLLRDFVGTKDAEGTFQSCPGDTLEARASATAPPGLHETNTLVRLPAFAAQFNAINLKGIDIKDPNHILELNAEGIDTTLPNAARVNAFAARALGIPMPLEGLQPSELEGIIDLSNDGDGYCRNVESFKLTGRKIIAGAETLTTAARLAWWQSPDNALPTDVKYFSITGTMGDATVNGKAWEFTTNPVAYDPRSVDFRSLRGNFYDLFAASHGNQLQDSQVPVQRGRFWPELHTGATAIGTPLTGFKTYFMGTLGVHHWGLAFPRAYSSHDGLEANPFPRTTLLKTIATFVNQVDKGDK